MSSFEELLTERGELPPGAVRRLQALAADWQILADLAFSDLLLCVRETDGDGLLVAAHMRPYTAQTVHPEDLVGTPLRADARSAVLRAL